MGGIFDSDVPEPPSKSDSEIRAEAEAERRRRRQAQGRGSTLLTGGQGLDGEELETATKTLGGG